MGERKRRFGQRVAAAVFRLMDAGRTRRAFEAARQEPTGTDFAEFDGLRQCLLVTYSKSGEPMPSPINFGLSGGKLYVRTDASTGKVKRLQRNLRVVLIPSGLRGAPRGAGVAATARILPDADADWADAIVAANWSFPMRLLERGLDLGAKTFEQRIVYIEFSPAPAA